MAPLSIVIGALTELEENERVTELERDGAKAPPPADASAKPVSVLTGVRRLASACGMFSTAATVAYTPFPTRSVSLAIFSSRPTEAAALACAYAGFVTCLVYRELGMAEVLAAAEATVRFCGQVLLIVACANVFGWLLTVQHVPEAVVAWVGGWQLPAWALLLGINVLLLIVGCLIDPISAILMLAPLLVPVVQAAGIDTVHFGIVMTVNLAIGLFTPPFGINLFVAQSALGLPLKLLYRAIPPFFLVYLVGLLIVSYWPALSLLGPQWLLASPP